MVESWRPVWGFFLARLIKRVKLTMRDPTSDCKCKMYIIAINTYCSNNVRGSVYFGDPTVFYEHIISRHACRLFHRSTIELPDLLSRRNGEYLKGQGRHLIVPSLC